MNDTLKQDTNTMLSEIEPYFEQIQEYLHYDEEQRLLICVIGSNAQANSQVVSLLEQKLEWPEKLAQNRDSFIKQWVQLETWWDPKKCTYIDPQV